LFLWVIVVPLSGRRDEKEKKNKSKKVILADSAEEFFKEKSFLKEREKEKEERF